MPKTGKVIFYCAGRECTLSVDSGCHLQKDGLHRCLGLPQRRARLEPESPTPACRAALCRKGNLIPLDTTPGKDTLVTPNNQTLQLLLADLKSDKGHALLEKLSRNAPLVVLERGDMNAVNAAMGLSCASWTSAAWPTFR